MLINDNKEDRKKIKCDQSMRKAGNNRFRGWKRLLLFIAGGILSAMAVFMIMVGTQSSVSSAVEQLVLITNSGEELPANEIKVMDEAQVYVKNYTDNSGVDIYYKFYDSKLNDTSGLDLSSNGEKYIMNSGITLSKTEEGSGSRYLYIHEKSATKNIISSFKVTFYQELPGVLSTPATSDVEMTALRVGDTISFASSGNIYYTLDGSEPNLIRDSDGSIRINGENFRLGNAQMKMMEKGNTITVTEDWLASDTKTIRLIAYKNGYDLGNVNIFRFKIIMDQAQAPTIKPVTTAEQPIVVESGTTASLATTTEDGVILYTVNGKVPTYTVEQAGDVYQVVPGSDSYIYTKPINIEGEPDEEIEITALTVKINTATGVVIMKDSEPVQFIYKITARGIAESPEVSPKAGTELALNSKVYLNTKTTNGTILYTLDGTAPDYEVVKEGTVYKTVAKGTTKIYGETTSYIEIKEPQAQAGQTVLIQAKTVKIDTTTGEKSLDDSLVVQFSYQITEAEMVAEPTATPATKADDPVIVSKGDKITLNSTTVGAKIYYTLDGTSPYIKADGTLSSSTKLYDSSQAVVVPDGTGFLTVTVVAVKEGLKDSETAQFIYQYPGTVAPPYVSPAEGTVSVNTEITLGSLDENARIYYTLDGSEPNALNGRIYSEPILLTQDTIIKAVCVVDGISSAVKTFTFYVAAELLPPSPSIASGAVLTSGTTIQLTAQKGAQIYYTTDGSSPKLEGAMVGNTVTLTGKAGDTVTVITYAKGSNFSDSQTVTYVYTISNYENGIKINPEPGKKVKEGDIITMETDVTDGKIYYAVGGKSPTSNGLSGTKVTVGESGEDEKFTLKATVVPNGSGFTSAIATYIYEYMEKPIAPKASIPNGAILLEEQEIVLTADAGDIYYTVDDSEPTNKSDLYTEPILVTNDTTIKAITMSQEGAESDVATFGYKFAQQTSAPVFSVKGGEVEEGTTLTITSETPNAVIYYTTDGQIPNLDNTKNLFIYSGAITLNKPVNIKAVAVKDKMMNSEVTSAIYTVKEPEVIVVDEEMQEDAVRESNGRLMSRRSYLGDSNELAYSDLVLRSPATGVVISAPEGAIPAETMVEVEETVVDNALSRAVETGVGEEYGAIASYEISLVAGEEKQQPVGQVEIGIPIPQKYSNSAISIAYVDEDGNVELHETRRNGNMAYAYVTHFSRYCIVAPVNFEQVETGMSIGKIVISVGVALFVAGYLLIRSGRKKEKDSILDN